MRRTALLLAVLAAAAAARAHVPNVYPVRVALRADPGVLRVTVEANALNWRQLAGVAFPEEGPWPAEALAASGSYLRARFPLSVDGKPLEGRVLSARLVHPLWKSAEQARVVINAVYPLPEGGAAFLARAGFFRDDREAVEGAGRKAPEGVTRDFRAFVRWSALPGGRREAALSDSVEVPLERLRRGAARRLWESAAAGIRAAVTTGGALALLAAALLFPPGPGAAKAGAGASAVLAAAGLLLPAGGGAALERCLWAAAAVAASASFFPRRAVPWLAGLALGVPCAARLWASAGAAWRDATGFSHFSRVAFLAGGLLVVAAALPAGRALSAGYRRYFRFLTADELERQGLFHRRIAARFLVIAGLYWALSPLWS